MVSFSCEACGDVLTKGKLDKHRNTCRRATFTCIDCMTTFQAGAYKTHTSCISEAQKYEGSFYKDASSNKAQKRSSNGHHGIDNNSSSGRAMIPHPATVVDENDTDMPDMTVAELGIPPRAPSPPTATSHNVYDFLVPPSPNRRAPTLAAPGSAVSDDSHYARHGYSYGSGPLKAEPSLRRYDSFGSMMPQPGSASRSFENGQEAYYGGEEIKAYLTPAPSGRRREDGEKHGADSHNKSERKRKRERLEELDTRAARDSHHHHHHHRDKEKGTAASASTPGLHSGLTGGLGRLLSRPVEELERQVDSPSAGTKRSKRDKERNHHAETRLVKVRKDRRGAGGSSSSEDDTRRDRDKVKRIEYRRTSAEAAQQQNNGQVVKYGGNPAELFLSFITKGEQSERGMSVNKVLKRFHRERRKDGEEEKKGKEREEVDKELWKALRVRRNERGEILLFV